MMEEQIEHVDLHPRTLRWNPQQWWFVDGIFIFQGGHLPGFMWFFRGCTTRSPHQLHLPLTSGLNIRMLSTNWT